jgi:hypothetical protein
VTFKFSIAVKGLTLRQAAVPLQLEREWIPVFPIKPEILDKFLQNFQGSLTSIFFVRGMDPGLRRDDRKDVFCHPELAEGSLCSWLGS